MNYAVCICSNLELVTWVGFHLFTEKPSASGTRRISAFLLLAPRTTSNIVGDPP